MKTMHATRKTPASTGKTVLLAALFSLAGTAGLFADHEIDSTLTVNDLKDIPGDGTVILKRDAILRYTGPDATLTRPLEIQPTGRRRHGYASVDVAKPETTLTLTLVHGSIERGVFRRTEKRGPGTLLATGDANNPGAKWLIREGLVILAKASNNDVHAQGSGFLEIYEKGVARLGGTGGDQILDEAGVIVENGGTFDVNTRTETVGTLILRGGTLRFAFGGTAGATGTITARNEDNFKIFKGEKGRKNVIAIEEGTSWIAGTYDLVRSVEEIKKEELELLALEGIPNGELVLSKDKKTLQLLVAPK
jgi:hypothetical protein